MKGSFFLSQIRGVAGLGVRAGQALCGDPSPWTHAGIILDEAGTVLEAEPGGARLSNLKEYAGRPLLISDAPVQKYLLAMRDWEWFLRNRGPTEAALRDRVVAQARALVGVPYSLLDYAALGALHLGLPSGAIRQRVKSSGHMICSQLVDAVYERAGIHLFSDGRWPGDVMPADLARVA